MSRSAFAIDLFALAFGFSTATPARADFAVVQYGDGTCRIWWDSGADPWGTGWRKIAIGLPDWSAASVALDTARARAECP